MPPPPPPFEVMLPEIETRSRRHYSRLPASTRDEKVQESVCQAFALYDSAIARGNFTFTVRSLAQYANKAVDAGRRFAGGWIRKEALHCGRSVGFDALDADGRNIVAEALVHRQMSPLNRTRIKLDWSQFLRDDLSEREAWLVKEIASGTLRSETALSLGLSPGRVTQIMDEVADAYIERFGTPGFERKARRKGKKKSSRKPRTAAA